MAESLAGGALQRRRVVRHDALSDEVGELVGGHLGVLVCRRYLVEDAAIAASLDQPIRCCLLPAEVRRSAPRSVAISRERPLLSHGAFMRMIQRLSAGSAGGWKQFNVPPPDLGFRNQGDCVAFFNAGLHAGTTAAVVP
jgi:hypothetical protein